MLGDNKIHHKYYTQTKNTKEHLINIMKNRKEYIMEQQMIII
jgi:hypothetical protein